ncbi:MAG: CpaF family protein [Candidatus Diapherotrites archaeon]|jgi:flagellar protein FlaI|uniref:CpaF family protein n=1 Tax=Candidatus Iainarchaeum sp. TaxID=3101447 RepID=A0A7K4BYZ3_9ARCH|nr:CpaF family protein [Candidatus Diapherotrites archaeon]
MSFAEIRLKKIFDSPLCEIHEGVSYNFYDVKLAQFSEIEQKFANLLIRLLQRSGSFLEFSSYDLPDGFSDAFKGELITFVESNGLVDRVPSNREFILVLEVLARLVSNISFISNKTDFCEYVLQNAIGLKQLAFFSLDDDLEELMINGPEKIFVFHKKFGMCKLNISLDEKSILVLIKRIAFSSGRPFDSKNPILDTRLPDGSRVNAVLGNLSKFGLSLTVRKFSQVPLTVLDLIENRTISSELAAFLWVMVDGGGNFQKNILIVGGAASGKTTLLNVLSNFSRLHERVVSIEDTLEISLLSRDNWVALESKNSADDEITMDDLLKNSLRMRPDRIIVGEVRGKEALTLFTAMDNGHTGCLGTIHANNSREAVVKLQERPFLVPSTMIPLVDLIIVIQRFYSKELGIKRRVTEISEVSRMDNKVLLGNIYDFDETLDQAKRTEVPSRIMDVLSNQLLVSKIDLKKEIDTRKLILEWMIKKDIRKPNEVLEFIQTYYYRPDKVLQMIKSNK